MSDIGMNDLRAGTKVEYEGNPFNVVSNQFVKPGKGQAFNRVKIKNLRNGKVIEVTFKSDEKIKIADVEERSMRFTYKDTDSAEFMDDETFDQVSIPLEIIGEDQQWLKEDIVYEVVFYEGNALTIQPPTFMNLKIVETHDAVRGDTATGGRITKEAKLETGAVVQVPIFIDQDEVVKVDTRSGEYVSRAN
jgi:elongation factor P